MKTTEAPITGKTVTVQGGTLLFVVEQGQQVPAAFALLGNRAKDKVCIRIAGGCKGQDDASKEAMMEFFKIGMRGFEGIAFSGGTRELKEDGSMNPMVTDIPWLITETNPGAIALGTAPRTGQLRLIDESVFVLNEYGNLINPGMAGVILVQDGADNQLEWDGDLDLYFDNMQQWESTLGFTLGMISWNGGLITATEQQKSIDLGLPTILIKGSGRETDTLITKYEEGGNQPSHVFVINKDEPEELNVLLKTLQLIK